MPVGRYARHTKPLMLQAIREVIFRHEDFESDGASDATLTIAGFTHNVWNFATGADNYVIGDLKLPRDRVLGTEIRFRPVFHLLPGGNEGASIVWQLNYRVYGVKELMALVTTRIREEVLTGLQTGRLNMSPGIKITSPELDPKYTANREGGIINFYLMREGTNPLDNFNTTVSLLKLIVEYTAWI